MTERINNKIFHNRSDHAMQAMINLIIRILFDLPFKSQKDSCIEFYFLKSWLTANGKIVTNLKKKRKFVYRDIS